MKRTNKGFTLVELLLSIAVFAIVMVSVISIMSSTLSAYSRANLDVTVQEDCQIVANQLEEILCDATEISGSAVGSGLTVKTKNTVRNDSGSLVTQNNTYVITYTPAAAPGSTGEIQVVLNGGTPYTLAKNVSSFDVQGWSPETSSSVYSGNSDNKTFIKLGMDVNGSTYNIDRAVYFRNNVEVSDFNSIKYMLSSTPGPSPIGDPQVKEVEIKRYQTINLSADYGILYGAGLYAWDGTNCTPDSTASTYFTLTKEANFPGVFYGPSYDVESNINPVSCFVTTGATINGNFVNPLAGNQFAVMGYKDTAMTPAGRVIVVFKVKPVNISDDNIIQAHNGANGTVNGEGFTCPINVDGIDVNEAIKKGVTVTTQFEISQGGSDISTFALKTISSTDGVINLGDYLNDRTGAQADIGIAPDPYNGDLFVIFNNYGLQYISDSGNLKLNTHINIGGTMFNNSFKLDKLDTTL